jgi:alkylhydroperoxidase family enzyme
VGIARSAGLSDAEIVACAASEPGEPLGETDLVLLRGVDELVADHELADATWTALSERFDDAGMIEFTLLVGHYAMIAGLLRSARVAPDAPLPTIGSVQ